MIAPSPHIAAMAPYALARMEPPPGVPLISLSQNESLRPPSPRVTEAATAALTDASQYPDPDWTALRMALSAVHTVTADDILCGAGSLDLIGCLMRIYAGPDRSVLAPLHAYPFFRSAALMAGARFDTAPEVGGRVDVEAILAAVKPDTSVVCVANPANPTGTRIPRADLIHLREKLPADTLLIIDEAYGEFADHMNEPSFDFVEAGNAVVLRTLSKAYGLAGSRVGWGLFPPAISTEMRKVMNPNNLSSVSQAAARAAVEDQPYMRETCQLTASLRESATVRLSEAGFRVLPSLTNFLLIDLGTPSDAEGADAALRSKGIFLRPQGGANLPAGLRMTIAAPALMDGAINQLIKWKETRP